MTPKTFVALALADTFLAHDASTNALIAGARRALGKKWRWIPSLFRTILKQHGEQLHCLGRSELAALILAHDGFSDAWQESSPPQIRHYCLDAPLAVEQPGWLAALGLPRLASVAELAQWLQVAPLELDWFADKWRNNMPAPSALQHYHYRWLQKRSGGLRLLEIPKLRLRAMQSQILRHLLDLVPPHPAAHGFRRAHSCATHAALHAGKRVVMRMDLSNFFPSIPAARIHGLFVKLGYPANVAGVFSRLCTHRTPASVLANPDKGLRSAHVMSWQERLALRTRHLPQGSPCSPALANLCAYRLDMRLQALAVSLNASYSRYADDLVFSGDQELERAMHRFHVQVAAIALEEGFSVNTRKTRMMRSAVRQQITGIVVNSHPNIARPDFDNLKAALTNCIRHGPASQNREGRDNYRQFLAGKVAYLHMVNPQRGKRLQQLFEQIVWSAD
ncbi:reverse transcriptase (RNA-dependent DNA polymerase) [Collimonas sp. PA-H2]|uniref:reverse transcriptase family protein n=1 Tax=Collimonas sp. PA-H2 TaxID=1881062 RepID=UPI000BF60B99|nr:reverse transcriptase family protein [Collimonas sp. PA-H2]PFH12244.1 reverse transcriptase (RNA-dependent DNA polymerase) [Collimonas sp. PA-H2]